MPLRVDLSEGLQLGHPKIDDDHRRIADLINRIAEAVEQQNLPLCAELLDGFLDLIQEHFRREEEVLAEIGYPQLEKHIESHRGLLARARSLRSLCEEMAERQAVVSCFRELASFLIDDVVAEDMVFKSHLQEASEGGRG